MDFRVSIQSTAGQRLALYSAKQGGTCDLKSPSLISDLLNLFVGPGAFQKSDAGLRTLEEVDILE